ncbi:hypothetical protein AAHC03_024229 [Spirometra sp. Aus1]
MPRANATFTLFNSDSLLTATKLAKVSFVWTPSTTTTISPNTTTEPPATSSTTPTASSSSTPKPEVSTTTSTTTSSPPPGTTSVKPPTTEKETLPKTTTSVSISIEATMNTTVEVTDSTVTTPDETTYTVVGKRVGTDGTTPDASVQIQLTTHNGQQPQTVEWVDVSPASNIPKSTVETPTYSDSLNAAVMETTPTARPNKYHRRRADPSNMMVDSPNSSTPENSGLVNSFAPSSGQSTTSAPEAAQKNDADTTSFNPEENVTSASNATWTTMPDTGIGKNISSAVTPALTAEQPSTVTAALGITASNSTY